MCEPIAFQDEPDCFQQQKDLEEYQQFLMEQWVWWQYIDNDLEWIKSQEGL